RGLVLPQPLARGNHACPFEFLPLHQPGLFPTTRAATCERVLADSGRICRGFENSMSDRQFIYHMRGLTKTFPPAKKVLDNIHLSFYPHAKIGVLGVNGSGKSTLLRIMAGIEKEFTGEAWVAEGARVGYLEQEPQLNAKKTVRENIMEGVADKKALLDRYNEIA